MIIVQVGLRQISSSTFPCLFVAVRCTSRPPALAPLSLLQEVVALVKGGERWGVLRIHDAHAECSFVYCRILNRCERDLDIPKPVSTLSHKIFLTFCSSCTLGLLWRFVLATCSEQETRNKKQDRRKR